jgi:hypothetical protein
VTHSHGGVTHTHPDGADIADGREGWHVHLSFFGVEVTLWEPGSTPVEAEDAPVAVPRPESGEDGGPVLAGGTSAAGWWMSLLSIESGPLPARVRAPEAGLVRFVVASGDERAASVADAPPVPPPEAV